MTQAAIAAIIDALDELVTALGSDTDRPMSDYLAVISRHLEIAREALADDDR